MPPITSLDYNGWSMGGVAAEMLIKQLKAQGHGADHRSYSFTAGYQPEYKSS